MNHQLSLLYLTVTDRYGINLTDVTVNYYNGLKLQFHKCTQIHENIYCNNSKIIFYTSFCSTHLTLTILHILNRADL